MTDSAKGFLIIIGGAEDKRGDSIILRQIVRMLSATDLLTILTTATEYPEEIGYCYKDVFGKIGVENISILNIDTRTEAESIKNCEILKKSRCVFMTGGDQLRITSILGGTAAGHILKELYLSGGIIVGTSAGASAMSSTMVVRGNDNEPARKCTLKMAPGLGLLDGVIIDQHFDQRGRFGRLLCGICENPGVLGIGIDENTAIKLFPDKHFEIIGDNAVTIIDGKSIKYSNVSELNPNDILAITGVTVHVLPEGYGFDLIERKVLRLKHEN